VNENNTDFVIASSKAASQPRITATECAAWSVHRKVSLEPKSVQLPVLLWDASRGTPVPFLWLVPSIVFNECRAGLMDIEPQPQIKEGASEEVVKAHQQAAALRASARHLARWVVQYAVEIPSPQVASPMRPAEVSVAAAAPQAV